MSVLLDKQQKFTRMLPLLFNYIHNNGYEFTLGEALRTPEMAEIYAKQGKGIKHSLHLVKLAIDLNMFKNGVYLQQSSQFKDVGEYWESIGGTWGGRFNDGNHFSLEHNGVK